MKNFYQPFLALLAFALVLWVLTKAGIIFIYLIMAAILAYLLDPLVDFLVHAKINRVIAIILVYLEVLLVLGVFILIFMPTIVAELKGVFSVIPSHLERFKTGLLDWLYQHRQNYYVNQFSQRFAEFWRFSVSSENWLANTQKIAFRLVSSIFHFFFSLIIVMVITFYLLLESKKLKNWFLGLLPEAVRFDASRILNNINEKISLYVRAQFAICLFVAICNVLILMVLGVDYAFVVGMIAGVATIVPILGSVFGVTANLFFGLLNSPVIALVAISGYLLIHFLTDHFISPQVIGRRTEIHPLVVLLGVLIGAELLGPLGILIAVPVMITLKEVFLYFDQKEIKQI